MEPPAPNPPPTVITGSGETRCRRQPKADRFQMLAALWFLPSLGALVILAADFPKWSDAGGFTGFLRGLRIEHWIAVSLLLAHPVFGWLARHYRRTEPILEEILHESTPDEGLHKPR